MSDDTIRSPQEIARLALTTAKDSGVIRDFALRPGGRATIYLGGGLGKLYTKNTLDTLVKLNRMEKLHKEGRFV